MLCSATKSSGKASRLVCAVHIVLDIAPVPHEVQSKFAKKASYWRGALPGSVVPAFGFRLQAKAGETARKSTVFEKPGEYEYSCDLPGHRDAGMKGTLIVHAF
jgi:plastocyanin